MQVGFIGTGSMGSILIEAFMEAKALLPSQIYTSNRTFIKAKELAQTYTGLHAFPSNSKVAQLSDLLFICVRPLDFKKVIDEISPVIREEQIIISITSPIETKDLEQLLPAKVAKIIPSITNAAKSGSSLLIAGTRLEEEDKHILDGLMRSISQPLWIDEQYTRVSSDISSCGPAFMSYILQEFIHAAVRETGIPEEQATALAGQMLIGMGELLTTKKFTLASLQDRVCVPGGVTGVGLQVLKRELHGVFEQLYRQTHEKYHEDLLDVHDMFYERESF